MMVRGRFKRSSSRILAGITLGVCALATTGLVATADETAQSSSGAAAPSVPTAESTPASTTPPTTSASTELAPGVHVVLATSDLPQGGVGLIRVTFDAERPEPDLSAKYDGNDLPFFPATPSSAGKVFLALFGVSHDQKPGQASVDVSLGSARTVLSFSVHDGGFQSEQLKVDAKKVNPPKKEMVRIQKEQVEIGKIYRLVTREALWSGPWVKPIDSPFTSPWGTRRLYNGEQRNYHPGLDLKAAIGTPIHAPAGGKVVMAKDLYFTGNTVVIDHGYGLISLYAHMSKLRVKVGALVERGTLLGLSGKTGRVTGPHLHWQIVLHKTKVNPAELLKTLQGI